MIDKTKVVDNIKPPLAKKIPKVLSAHGVDRIDNYYWLNERGSDAVIDYLNAENEYTQQVMKPTEELQETLFKEIKGRVKQDESSAPYRHDDYFYYLRYADGYNYPIYCRKYKSLDNQEEIILDDNKLAEGKEYHQLGGLSVNDSHSKVALAVDNAGRRIYNLSILDLTSKEYLPDTLENFTGNFVWLDDKHIIYTRACPDTLRPYQVYVHKLGSPANADKLLYEELDTTFEVYLSKASSRKHALIYCHNKTSSEYLYIEKPISEQDELKPQVFIPRSKNHEYDVDNLNDVWYILSNHVGSNFGLYKTTQEQRLKVENWDTVLEHNQSHLLEDFTLFDDFIAVKERAKGSDVIRVIAKDGGSHIIELDEECYTLSLGTNVQTNDENLRINYSAFNVPTSVFDYNMRTRTKNLVKQSEVLGDFSSDNYTTKRIFAEAEDGTEVPISLIYRKDKFIPGTNPTLLYGYGSYGISMNPSFRSSRLSLLDRGFVFAIAHVRGGQELGRQWYEQGKFLNKKNTFTDFIVCAKKLLGENICAAGNLFAAGGSAGGLLMGAVVNMEPKLFRAVLADVPFVDVLTTMQDNTIPLTTGEYEEWGNPDDKEYHDYILSYSPIDNIKDQQYPDLLVTTGIEDSQVQYWEPAKWVAKLRALKNNTSEIILKTDMNAGHSGGSGRDKQYKEIAYDFAYLLRKARL